jgi:signal transduction histidine kinase
MLGYFILGVLLIITILYGIYYRRQIKDICRQIEFVQKTNSNKIISADIHSMELQELMDKINDLIGYEREERNRIKDKDQQLKDTITSISHDIRTPLTSMDGYFQLLQETNDNAKKEQYISVINGRIDTLRDILDQLFTYVKLENDHFHLEPEQCNLTQNLCDVLFSFEKDVEARNIELEAEIDDKICCIVANETGVKRMLQNIIKNAIEHGTDYLGVSLKHEKTHAIICIKNHVSSDLDIDINRVFEQFYKADPARRSSSTGLGLFIAKQLAERMDGTIEAAIIDDCFQITVTFDI